MMSTPLVNSEGLLAMARTLLLLRPLFREPVWLTHLRFFGSGTYVPGAKSESESTSRGAGMEAVLRFEYTETFSDMRVKVKEDKRTRIANESK